MKGEYDNLLLKHHTILTMDFELFKMQVAKLENESYEKCERLLSKKIAVVPAGRFYRLSIVSLKRWSIDVDYVIDSKPWCSKGNTPWRFNEREYFAEERSAFVKVYGNSVNYVITSRPYRFEIEKQLLDEGIKPDNIFYMPIRLGKLVPSSCFIRKQIIDKEFEKIQKASSLLFDDESRKQLWELLTFFYADAPIWIEKRPSEEYFNNGFWELGDDEVFFDAGMYDGMTSIRFAELCPNYKTIYGVEANPSNIKMINERLSGYRNVNIYNNALCNEESSLRFSTEGVGSEGARLKDNGDIEVKGLRGDSLNIKPTFIKFDIEGAEFDALCGFEKTIKTYKPKMAVSVYHSLQDHWRLISKINEFCPEYKMRLVHHYGYEDLYGTILYASVE